MTSEASAPTTSTPERVPNAYARFCASLSAPLAAYLGAEARPEADSAPVAGPAPEPPTRLVFNKYHSDAPADAVYIGRGSPYGNPFVIGDRAEGKHGTRDEVIAAHAAWLAEQPDLLARIRAELRGRALVCFCYPAPCHGDTLAAIANSPADEPA